MNNNLFYCHSFLDFLLFYISWKIDIFLADRLELWPSIFLHLLTKKLAMNKTHYVLQIARPEQ